MKLQISFKSKTLPSRLQNKEISRRYDLSLNTLTHICGEIVLMSFSIAKPNKNQNQPSHLPFRYRNNVYDYHIEYLRK